MDMRSAFRDTLALAEARNMPEMPGTELGLAHLRSMWERIERDTFSEGKLGRWLGWAQCMVAAAGCATLDDMKKINVSYAD